MVRVVLPEPDIGLILAKPAVELIVQLPVAANATVLLAPVLAKDKDVVDKAKGLVSEENVNL
jgi:hypothetical protein